MTDERPAYLNRHDEAVEEIGYAGSVLAMAIEDDQLDPSLRKLALGRASVRRALARNQALIDSECVLNQEGYLVGHVQDLWYKTAPDPVTGGVRRVRTKIHGKGQRYRVRYMDPSGRERSRSFPDRRKKEADDYLGMIEHSKREGTYYDPDAGEIRFDDYAMCWLESQTFDEATRQTVGTLIRKQTNPYLGKRLLASLTATDIRSWQRALQDGGLSASYRRGIFTYAQAILDSAVDDGKIRKNPCKAHSVRKPRAAPRKLTPWSAERVHAVRELLPQRLQVAVALGAGLGLRYGEASGLAVEDVDFDGQIVYVVRGLKILAGGACFGPPKGGKTRQVPLPASVAEAIRGQLRNHPPASVTLPWQSRTGRPVTANLILHNLRDGPLWRPGFTRLWRNAVQQATGKPPTRADGFHALRHFYASTLLDGGETITALSEYLGHSDPGFTLRTYTHLMPRSHHRTRDTIDIILDRGSASDGMPTA